MFNLEDDVVRLLSTYYLSDILQAISEEVINQKEEYDQSYADLEHRINDLEYELRVVRFRMGIWRRGYWLKKRNNQ